MLGRAVAWRLQFYGLSMPVDPHGFADQSHWPVAFVVVAGQERNRQILDFDFGGTHWITDLPVLHGWGSWPVGVGAAR